LCDQQEVGQDEYLDPGRSGKEEEEDGKMGDKGEDKNHFYAERHV